VKAIFVELQEHQNRFERRYHPSLTLRLLFLFYSFRWAGDFFAGFLDDFVAVVAFTAAFFFFVAYMQPLPEIFVRRVVYFFGGHLHL
jgi:hypothetical protein